MVKGSKKTKVKPNKVKDIDDNPSLTQEIAIWLWTKYSRTKLSDDWNKETPQRQLQWTTDAQTIRNMVQNYYIVSSD